MCTSFLFRGKDTFIAMNYDNQGKNLKLAPYREDRFLVTLHSLGKDRPLFGIRNDGVMVNQQVVDDCEKGKFRMGLRTMDTSTFIGKMLLKPKSVKDIDRYLQKHRIVNPPKISLHVMVACPNQMSYIIEPGRGIIPFSEKEQYVVMSNCPVSDFKKNGEWNGMGVDRQLKAEEELAKGTEDFTVQDAFSVLKKVHQTDERWGTEFSFVYSYNENTVYYCYDHQFDQIHQYKMKR
ncbi:hypothetical protein [Anaerosporobacter faecicola]|uniref:hypothetical protein n=1 Tax=Anaerosporobacter faecicola TaxID=2718714 RepID=UPI00143B62D2|nr:hypothetical protein [Anaerosporobacter faecicola]